MNFLLAKLVIEPKANIYIKQEEWNGNCKQFDGIAFPCFSQLEPASAGSLQWGRGMWFSAESSPILPPVSRNNKE